ncbi:MAG: alpha/beta hydrolase, partial [Bacteroidetes bacterium]|nr:alpha/beta hydrolase [Bacteroidota bacterium]
MKKYIGFLLLFLIPSYFIYAQNNTAIIGSWIGKLDLGSAQLTIVFHISEEDGKLQATMDSPDQGANGIAVEEVIYNKGQIKLNMPNINGGYEGDILVGDSTIEGKW